MEEAACSVFSYPLGPRGGRGVTLRYCGGVLTSGTAKFIDTQFSYPTPVMCFLNVSRVHFGCLCIFQSSKGFQRSGIILRFCFVALGIQTKWIHHL